MSLACAAPDDAAQIACPRGPGDITRLQRKRLTLAPCSVFVSFGLYCRELPFRFRPAFTVKRNRQPVAVLLSMI
jgi:hypothetical protein